MAKDIEVKKTQALSTAINYDDDAYGGTENFDRDSIAIPFLKVLQSTSPECNEDAPEYIKDAKAGQFINSVTREVLGNSVVVVPCYYKRVFNKWGDRLKGGGYKGALEVGNPEIDQAKKDESSGRLLLNNGDYLSDTRNHFVLLLNKDKNEALPMLLSLSSTQISESKKWNTQVTMLKFKNAAGETLTLPMFSHSYLIESITKKNDKGTWKGVKISLHEKIEDSELYRAAKEFHAQVKENRVEVAEPVKEEF